jgi:O-antigen/teichoic acid export membrane protein
VSSPAPTAAAASLKEKLSEGVVWGAGGAVFYQLVALFVQTALTYFLSKQEYGSYAKAFALLSFAVLIQQLGFNEVLLRKQSSLHKWLPSAFVLALVLGLTGSAGLFAIAGPIGRFYDDSQLTALLELASPLPVVRSLCIVPMAVLSADMRFRMNYGLMLLNALATSLLTLTLAWLGCGVLSFPLSMLIVEPVTALMWWRSARPRVFSRLSLRRWRLFPARWRRLLGDLRFTLGASLSRWMRTGTDSLALGAFAAPAVVGVYFFAQSLVVQIVRVTTLNLSGVLLPALNRFGDDPPRQVQAFLQAARVLVLIGAPLCVGLGAVGSLFVRVFLDADKWRDLPPVLAILAGGVIFRLLDEPINALLAAQGRFRSGFTNSLCAGITYAVFIVIGASTGSAIVTALAAAAFFVIAGPVLLSVAIKASDAPFGTAVRVFAIPATLAAVAIVPWLTLDRFVPGSGRMRDVLVLIATIAGGAITYGLLARTMRPPGWVQLIERIEALAPRRLRPMISHFAGVPSVSAPST